MTMGSNLIHRLVAVVCWCCVVSAAACGGPPASPGATAPTPANTAPPPSITPFVLLPGPTSGPTLRASVGTASGTAVAATPFTAAAGGPSAASIPILMYHQVKDLPPTAGLEDLTWTISPASLDAQLGYLADKGYVTISLDQLLDGLAGKAALPAKPVVITFDDGWRTQYTNALPMLKKYKQTATFYVVSSYMGYGAYFDWDMTTEIKSAGMTIAGHTLDHANLPTLSAAAVDKELRDSKAALESKLGITVDHFAYPYGAYNDAVIAAVKRAGYRSAATINPVLVKNPVSTMLLPRIRMSYRETLADFVKKLP
jgi:peptidoglycan/xylan/chitin deacetylase (PgdA/CDA1 family)